MREGIYICRGRESNEDFYLFCSPGSLSELHNHAFDLGYNRRNFKPCTVGANIESLPHYRICGGLAFFIWLNGINQLNKDDVIGILGEWNEAIKLAS